MMGVTKTKTEDQRIVLGWMGALVGPGGGVGGWLVGVKNHRLMYGNMVRPQVYTTFWGTEVIFLVNQWVRFWKN